ncbi:unnamed protein product, partial [Heterosigma akashiwo]
HSHPCVRSAAVTGWCIHSAPNRVFHETQCQYSNTSTFTEGLRSEDDGRGGGERGGPEAGRCRGR